MSGAFRMFHLLVPTMGRGTFICVRCKLRTNLAGAVQHAVQQQIDLTRDQRPTPREPSDRLHRGW